MSEGERRIGLPGAVFTLVGYVIGASIFILPGQLAADVGPGAFVSYLIAGVLAALGSVVAAQIGSALPVSGSLVVAASRVLSPMVGFFTLWALLLAVGVAISLVAFGMVDYLAYFLPGLPRSAAALAVTVVFTLLNLTPVRVAVGLQAAMTVGFLAVLLVFGVGGTVSARSEYLTPLLPTGLGAVVLAAVPAYFSYSGAFVIVELGGDIRDPARTLPRALLIGFAIIAAVYALVAYAVPAVIPWESLAGVDAPIARAAQAFLPSWVGGVVAVAAMLAAGTSINGMLLVHSRDIVAMARAQVFPAALGSRSRGGVPVGATLALGAVGFLSVLVGGTIREYAVLVVTSVMLLQAIMAITLLRMPIVLPEALRQASFRLGRTARWIFGVLTLVASIGFMFLAVGDNLRNGLVYLGVLALGGVYFSARRRIVARRGGDLNRVLGEGSAAEG
ncbi:MAG: APC family permease [Vicinamibacterales bacterium]